MSNGIVPASPPSGALRDRDGADSADPRIARAEQRLAMLRELSDLGMAMTRRLARRALAPPDADAADPAAPAEAAGQTASAGPAPGAAPGPRHDPADSFAKLSRAIRLTVAQETRTDDDLAALRAGDPVRAAQGPVDRADREAGDGCDAEDAETFDDYDQYDDYDDHDDGSVSPSRDNPFPRRDGVRDRMFDAISAEIGDVYRDGVHRDHAALRDQDQRPIEDEPRDAYANGPVGQAAEATREDPCPHPDRNRWTGEDWAPPPPDEPRHPWRSGWSPESGLTERRRQ